MFNQLKKHIMTSENFLSISGLDFTVSKRALSDFNGKDSGYFGLFNDKLDKCIHTVKKGYHVSQNKEVLDMVLQGITPFGSDLTLVKGGSINDGRKIYLQLGIEGDALFGGDRIKRFITIIDSNDGSTSLSVGIGDLTMSCANQFFKFYKAGESKFRHSASLEKRLLELPKLIEENLEQSLRQVKFYEDLTSVSIRRSLADEMVNYLLGFDRELTSVSDLCDKSTRSINKMDDLYSCIDTEIKDKGLNLWGLHSGVTSFTTHINSTPKRVNGGIESLLSGSGYAINNKSLDFVKDKMKKLELV
jgi:hypothetical protein